MISTFVHGRRRSGSIIFSSAGATSSVAASSLQPLAAASAVRRQVDTTGPKHGICPQRSFEALGARKRSLLAQKVGTACQSHDLRNRFPLGKRGRGRTSENRRGIRQHERLRLGPSELRTTKKNFNTKLET